MKMQYAVVLLSWLTCAVSNADVLTLTPVADSTVDALNPAVASPTGVLHATMVGPVDQQATQLTFFYAQYQLPNGMTGQNIASINSADIKITRSPSSAALSLTYYLFAVFDGIDTGSANTYTWNDGIGFDPTHTLVKFLNPNNEEIFYYSDPGESGFIGFIDTDSSGPPQRQFSFFPIQADFATQNLQDLFLQDTDGKLTIFGKVRQNFEVTPLQTLTSIEDGTRPAPTLVLDFVPGSHGIAGDYNNNGVVDAADYVVWRNNVGQSVTLPNDSTPGTVDQSDYTVWSAQFGNQAGAGVGTGLTNVPEPGSTALLLVATAPLFIGRRWSHRRWHPS
jgi:hypothetical protein